MTKKELIQTIEQLERVARDNKALAERAVTQAKEWMALYESASTEEDTLKSTSVH
jgi:hypothetical protein